MGLAKLTIEVEGGDPIEAQFNPDEITLERSVNWDEKPVAESDAPETQFVHGHASSFNIDLLFDTFELGEDVRTEHTDQVLALTRVDGELHRPPICTLSWGKLEELFKGVLESVTQRFTLFLEDGTPVRARLSCTFKEWRSAAEEARKQNKQSADVSRSHVVVRGDTLSAIAARYYKDPGRWRPIARSNRLENPRFLEPGRRLVIPALSSAGGAEG